MNIATYQATPEVHGKGYYFYTSCGHELYSVKDEMAYHGCLCPACFAHGRETVLYMHGSKEAKAYKLAIKNTKYSKSGKAVILSDDEWVDEIEWDDMFKDIVEERTTKK